MVTLPWKDLSLSRLALGTVQFGLNYGIANTAGQPAYEEVRAILRCAHEGGINCLDTAAFYGSSEEVLGRALQELGLQREFVVVTKVQHLGTEMLEGRPAAAALEESVAASLRKLRLESLPLVLLHREEDFAHLETLLRLRERGWVRHVGCSTATPPATAAILENAGVEAVQIPASVLDHRFAQAGIPGQAQRAGAALFVRSVFTQGLLLMPEEAVPPPLAEVIPVRRQLQELAAQAGLSLEQLAARYALSLPGLTSVVVGVDTLDQLEHNLQLFDAPPLDPALAPRIEAIAGALPEHVIIPYKWPKVRDPWGRW